MLEDVSMSIKDNESVAPGKLDVDVDEVKDRVDLLKDTVNQISNEKQSMELLKIVSKLL